MRRKSQSFETNIKTVLFCGQNNIAFRGSDDSGPIDLNDLLTGEGNFTRLQKFRVQSGDKELEEQVKSAPRNAC